ncbi:MAG: hypothetical protein GTO71_12695 [Woeseiaceae bacterium]|nr:hypothetical protein [Woeseiaceae bacterium]NIP21925.1 hypothetical protein [Woeseiaceae bacterium]NIS91010.1 hypothetical protein [Woeseiaceae bacterium]
MRLSCAVLFLLGAAVAAADDVSYEFGGHTKIRVVGQSYPGDSLFRDLFGSTSTDAAGELRANFSARTAGWSFHADYQLLGLYSEFLPLGQPNDDRRLFDLTRIVTDGSDYAWLHRLDRAWAGFAAEKFVVRVGRQALSWGNGLFFHPMDLVNPFDPTTIDTEYKTGDDMAYAQYLRDNGDDIQVAAVFRRDPVSGDSASDQGTTAIKYHGFAGEYEYDVLVAEHYGDSVLALGGVGNVGEAVWRGDVVVTDTDDETRIELVANLSYSWIWADKNVSGAAEYARDGDDRDYLAGSLMIEMSPLWTLTPTVIASIDDPSALLQFVTRYSLGDNLTFLGSLNVPLGANGTEFGGPDSGVPGRYLSFDLGIFAQLAWYF